MGGVVFIPRNQLVKKLNQCMRFRPTSTRQKLVLFFSFFDVWTIVVTLQESRVLDMFITPLEKISANYAVYALPKLTIRWLF